jgi:hypothetical protein
MRRALRRLRYRLWLAAHGLETRHARRTGGGEMRHPEDRAGFAEWGHCGDA